MRVRMNFLNKIITGQFGENCLEKSLNSHPNSISSSVDGVDRLDIPKKIFEHPSITLRKKIIWYVNARPYFRAIAKGFRYSVRSLNNNPKNVSDEISRSNVQAFENKAQALGVYAVGYTDLPKKVIFRNKSVLFDKVIVLLQEMKKKSISNAPSKFTFKDLMQSYVDLSNITNELTDFLRKRQIAVQAGMPLHGLTLYSYLAKKAGLGWHGKNGLLITPQCGPRTRISVIYTNVMNLPPTNDNPFQWVEEFCSHCKKCVRKCPGQAILSQAKIRKNELLVHIDSNRCIKQYAENYACSVCIKVCPFNLSTYEKIKQAHFKKPALKMVN